MNTRLVALALLSGALAVGCSSTEGPVAGELEVRLTSSNVDDRAVLFMLRGTQTAVTAPSGSGYRVLQSPLRIDTLRVLVIAPQGGHLTAGVLVRVAVPDTRQAASYSAVALDIASTTYASRGMPPFAGYQLSVVAP
jgi:hypothetical protein